MTAIQTLMLVAGLVFPALSLVTVIASVVHWWRTKKHASPVIIPFIGPILLTGWVILAEKPLLLIPVVWIADLGTLVFLAFVPKILGEWWRTSSFTRILALHGSEGVQSAIITFHSTGYYLLKKSWQRPMGECGIVGLSEEGVYIRDDGRIELTAHFGLRRILRKSDEGQYVVEEIVAEQEASKNHSLEGWRFREL